MYLPLSLLSGGGGGMAVSAFGGVLRAHSNQCRGASWHSVRSIGPGVARVPAVSPQGGLLFSILGASVWPKLESSTNVWEVRRTR